MKRYINHPQWLFELPKHTVAVRATLALSNSSLCAFNTTMGHPEEVDVIVCGYARSPALYLYEADYPAAVVLPAASSRVVLLMLTPTSRSCSLKVWSVQSMDRHAAHRFCRGCQQQGRPVGLPVSTGLNSVAEHMN